MLFHVFRGKVGFRGYLGGGNNFWGVNAPGVLTFFIRELDHFLDNMWRE